MAKLGSGFVSGLQRIEISDDDFRRIESAGKCQLPPSERKDIEEHLNSYVLMNAMEDSHPDSKEAERYVRSLTSKANGLIDIITKASSDKSLTARSYALEQIFLAKVDCKDAVRGKAQDAAGQQSRRAKHLPTPR